MKIAMKPFHFFISLISLSLILTACDNDLDQPDNPDIIDNIEQYAPDVTILNNDIMDNVEIVNDSTIIFYSNLNLNNVLSIGNKFVYYENSSAKNFFAGIVKNIESAAPKYVVYTSVPSFSEIFEDLDITPLLNSEDFKVDFLENADDNAIFKGIVSNDVWNNIETVYHVQDSVSSDSVSKSRSSSQVPIDVTLSFQIKPNQAFDGNVFLRLQGTIYIHDGGCFEMNVNVIVGLQGSFSMASVSAKRRYIPLLEIKNGITLYTNKIVGIRLKPSLNFFYGGEIKLEAGFKYEVINANCNVKYFNGSFSNLSNDNLKDTYFRVQSLHTEGEFGLSLNGDLYAFVFSDKFLSCGVRLVGGLSISGEKNVGIQFPDIANFDFSVSFSPIFEVTPFFAIRKPDGLKRFEGGTFKANTEKFSVDLLPNIHDINYETKADKLNCEVKITNENSCFIKTKENGIALFKQGEKTPVEKKCFISSSPSDADNFEFTINWENTYEIAKFSESEKGEIAYGERILIGMCPDDDHPHAIDLGLPSGTKWACCNVGASSPEGYGNYYAWGETSTKSSYTYENSLTCDKTTSELKALGIINSSGNLTPTHDAASVNWGGSWRMPTKAEQEELIKNCTWTWTSRGGHSGCKVTGSSGKSIFLPTGGWYEVLPDFGSASVKYCGHSAAFWSATPDSRYYGSSYELYFSIDYYGEDRYLEDTMRCYGQSVRPVSD